MKISRRRWMAAVGSVSSAAAGLAPSGARLEPVEAFAGSAGLDAILEAAVRADELPGAVLVVAHQGRIVHSRAYGSRALKPRREPMTLETIFDVASLTKVVATVPALMKLFEQGRLRLNDRVTRYLPEFQGGQSDATVRNLLTHFSGLRPDLDLEPGWSGYQTGIRMALGEKSATPPGTRFGYSDINFILLGEIVRRLAGVPLSEFARQQIFSPLGMSNTTFAPAASLAGRIAPTEEVQGRILRGVVHDPTARNMGGVAGHAGLFMTAADLARFAAMMLGEGEAGGVRLFSTLTVRKLTTPQSPPDQPILRGLGWDIDSPLSGSRGELFPIGSYGHSGFTGTSIWIDPVSATCVILLASSVHPRVRPPLTSLRARVATAVAAGLGISAPGISITGYNETLPGAGLHRVVARNASVLTGLDVLVQERFASLAGRRVGLITNHTGVDREGRRNVDRMLEAGLRVTALFSPEHGFTGNEDREDIPDGVDAATGIRVWSLYSARNRRPAPEMLRDVDVLVFDLQDVGARFYTYSTTLGYCLEAAAAHKLPFFVLDRPNPITGTHVEGPMLDAGLQSFVGYFPLPLRHGMTLAELARLFNSRRRIGAELHTVPMRNWERGDWFDSTGLVWISPSPNLRSLNAALLYPGVAMLEASTEYSVGRGTEAPFEQIGADWIRGAELAARLNSRFIPGTRAYATRFHPVSSAFAGREIEGVRVVVTDREAFDSARLGLEIAAALRRLYPARIALSRNRRLVGNSAALALLEAGEDPILVQQAGQDALDSFLKERREYLLYR
jgi:uncharacterized protein YbbC (DUF1343 family)/CubicO group peptidase (beta-lactamase class C family)